jgi:hypothetical protein
MEQLVELSQTDQLQPKFAVVCEQENANIQTFDSQEQIPDKIFCDLCRENHRVDEEDILLIFHRPPVAEPPDHPTKGRALSSSSSAGKDEPNQDNSDAGFDTTKDTVNQYANELGVEPNEVLELMMDKITILMFSADPTGQSEGKGGVQVGKHCREVSNAIQRSGGDDRIDLDHQPATNLDNLISQITKQNPDVVHFVGHGSTDGVQVYDDDSGAKLLETDEIKDMFQAIDCVRLVVLISCMSEPQANAISSTGCVAMGSSDKITVSESVNFATTFYNSLGNSQSIRSSFNLARTRVDHGDLGEGQNFRLFEEENADADDTLL